MKIRFYLLSILFVSFSFCFSQNNNGKNALFFNGGYRVNGGNFELSASYENFLGNSNCYSLYTAVNYQDVKTTMVDNITSVRNTLAEIGGKVYFLKNQSNKISPFVGLGFVAGNSHIKGNEKQNISYPVEQNKFNYGGVLTAGAEYYLTNSFSIPFTAKYMYDNKNHIFLSLGMKVHF